jgi:hypothetical protein
VSGRRVAARVSRHDLVHAGNLPKYGFNTPKTATRENRRLISLEKVSEKTLVV